MLVELVSDLTPYANSRILQSLSNILRNLYYYLQVKYILGKPATSYREQAL